MNHRSQPIYKFVSMEKGNYDTYCTETPIQLNWEKTATRTIADIQFIIIPTYRINLSHSHTFLDWGPDETPSSHGFKTQMMPVYTGTSRRRTYGMCRRTHGITLSTHGIARMSHGSARNNQDEPRKCPEKPGRPPERPS